jgi:ABC-type transport system involved in multi-copper enzyme maturation permease subunit
VTAVAETPVAPYHSDLPAGRDGFVQLLHAEWTKLRTVRAWVIGLVVAALVLVLLSLFGADGSHASVCTSSGSGPSAPQSCGGEPPFPVGPGGEAVADSYSFVHRPLTGDGTITVQVTSLTGIVAASGNVGVTANGTLHTPSSNAVVPWAKAGLLVTDTTDPGSAYAAVMVTGSHGVRMQYNYTHDTAGIPGTVSASSPRWLRLVRAGDAVTGYDSTDGTHWTSIGTAHLAGLRTTVQVGLFATSPVDFGSGHSDGSPSSATARFDNAGLQGDFPAAGWSYLNINGPVYPTLPFSVASAYHHSGGTFTVTGSGDIAPAVAGGPFGGTPVMSSIIIGGLAGIIVLIVLGTVFATSEYRRGLIRTTLAASPRRGRVLAAKAVVIGLAAFVVGLVATAIALPLTRKILHANGNALLPVSTLSDVRVVVGTAAVLALAAVIALALGTALRRSAGAVVASLVLFIVPFILGTTLTGGAAQWLLRLTPTAAFAVQGILPRYSQVSNAYTLLNGYYPLGPWAGLGVLCIYAAVVLGVATWLLRRRDA